MTFQPCLQQPNTTTTLLVCAGRATRVQAHPITPEELLVSSLSACHMLWYLHLCADAGVVVTDYSDEARGVMEETTSGGRFTLVVLQPHVTVASPDMIEKAMQLHTSAHTHCFIANSVNFEVHVEPEIVCM